MPHHDILSQRVAKVSHLQFPVLKPWQWHEWIANEVQEQLPFRQMYTHMSVCLYLYLLNGIGANVII